MKVSGKKIGAVLGGVVLASGAVAVPAFASAADATDAVATQAGVVAEAEDSAVGAVLAQPVPGTFTYSQGALTPNDVISSVFSRAAAALCVSPSYYGVAANAGQIEIGYNGTVIEATVDEMTGDEASVSDIIGCACSTNAPGGGAIVNAEVSGASIAMLAMIANAC